MSRSAWAHEIGAEIDAAGMPTPASIASHIRAATAAEGNLSSHRIVRGLKEAYAPFGADDAGVHQAIHDVLDRLVEIGDLTRFSTGAGAAYVATPERLVDLGDGLAVLGASDITIATGEGLVRRLSTAEAATKSSVPTVSLAEEVGPAAWRLHLVGLGGSDAAQAGPSALFGYLSGAAASGERIEQLGPDHLRVVSGKGDFFGNGRAPTLEGRWKAWSGGDAVCGLRKRAYVWQPCVVTETAQGPRVADVSDPDCWRWAVIGQSQARTDAVTKRADAVFQCLTPPPAQIRRMLTLAGEPAGAWRWTVGSTAADLTDSLLSKA